MKYISVLGWEDRFILGIETILKTKPISSIELFKFKEYNDSTQLNLDRLMKSIQKDEKIILNEYDVYYSDPITFWQIIEKWGDVNLIEGEELILDISTMTREAIWVFLFFLLKKKCKINYAYSTPMGYNDGILCKESGKPRLLFKHSGLSEFGKETALIVLSGYDDERVRHLVKFYEPSVTYIGIQTGTQFDNNFRNGIEMLKQLHDTPSTITTFNIDSYSYDHGFEVICDMISKLKDKYNIVASSLGPKLSAVSLYKAQISFPSVALAYVPAKDYNKHFTFGLLNTKVYTF